MVQELIYYIITRLVDKPHDVKVTLKEGEKTLLEVRVAPSDIARVIGKEGRTFKAVRALVASISPIQERDVILHATD